MPNSFNNTGDGWRSDSAMTAIGRLVLAVGGLIAIYLDPPEPVRFAVQSYAAMAIYSAYSLYVLLSVYFDRPLPGFIRRHSWWVDTAFYLLLLALSGSTSSIFFFFFFFAVVSAAFSRGFRIGIGVTLVSALGFFLISVFFLASSNQFDLGRFIVRPLSLLVVGYLMSVWGEHQIRSRRRLELLRDIGAVSNPRFGIDRTIDESLELLRDLYNAKECLFVTIDKVSGTLEIRHRTLGHSAEPFGSIRSDSPFAAVLLAPPEDIAAVWTESSFHAYDSRLRVFTRDDPAPFRAIAEATGNPSLLTCPVYYRGEPIGRFLVFSDRASSFERADIPFVLQAVDQFITVVENIRLVDRMASDAADLERKRIARNIHDSIIQPYVGLQLGIESLRQYVDEGPDQDKANGQISKKIARLEEIARHGVDDLRNYVHGLSSGSSGSSVLQDSVERFVETFSAGTGINVDIEFEPGLRVRDRLAAEVFQIIAEALSNVRKHARSKTASVRLSPNGDQLEVEIANPNDDGSMADFIPRSIDQRARSLGGKVNVAAEAGNTVVTVSIPM